MKKLHVNILLFLLPLVVIMILLPVSKRSKYVALKDNCFYTGKWIHDRLNIIETPVDIAFIGSSHTLNGVNDEMLDSLLTDKVNVVNLGFCKLGRDLHYSFVKEVIATKNPKRIVLEVQEGENATSHRDFPLMAETKDIFNASLSPSYFQNYYTHFAYKLEVFQGTLFSKIKLDRFWHNHGFTTFNDTLSADEVAALKIASFKSEKAFLSSLKMRFPKSYINKIATLCDENDVELSFLYLPKFGTKSKPEHYEYYQNIGRVFLPNEKLLSDYNNWYDLEHFNANGANKLSEWLSEELK